MGGVAPGPRSDPADAHPDLHLIAWPKSLERGPGYLRITADAALPEIFPLRVAGARGGAEPAELAVPAALTQKWPALTSLEGAPAYNVGRAYAAFAADIENGTHTVPDFADAVRRHEVIAAIARSAASGERVKT